MIRESLHGIAEGLHPLQEGQLLLPDHDFAIKTHRHEVSQVSKDNEDTALLTASIIRLGALVTLQDKELAPCSPPAEWLFMAKEAGYVFVKAGGDTGVGHHTIDTRPEADNAAVDSDEKG